jgi:endonuclease YncB( thermonuclease family)
MYEYRAIPLRVLDGDTVQFDVDLGLNVHRTEILRFLGVNAPETNSSDPVERQRGKEAKDFVTKILIGVPEPEIVAVIGTALGQLANTPPIDPTKIKALCAQFFPAAATEVKVRTAKPYSTDKYGRFLASVLYRCQNDPPDVWRNLCEELVEQGLAVRYDGGAR